MERARRSRVGRVVTVFAACLTFATAFGLHPEPAAGLPRTADATLLELPFAERIDSNSHDCVACRAHRPLLSMAVLALVPPLARSGARVSVSRPSIVPAFQPSRPDGRAPPASS